MEFGRNSLREELFETITEKRHLFVTLNGLMFTSRANEKVSLSTVEIR